MVSEERIELTFGESVQSHGLGAPPVSRLKSQTLDVIITETETEGDEDDVVFAEEESNAWDGGEEEDEDDELERGASVLRGFQPGWTLVDRLYLYNGSFYVVT